MGEKMKICSNHECHPDLGADANKLASLLATGLDVPSTKLGYGDGNITFTPNKNVSITFCCDGRGRFSIEHVFWNQPIDFNVAAKIVESLTACARIDVEKLRLL